MSEARDKLKTKEITMMKRENKKLHFETDAERDQFLEYYELLTQAEKVDIVKVYESQDHLGDNTSSRIVELSILKKVKE